MLEEMLETGSGALEKLEELLLIDQPDAIVRDAAIYRFDRAFAAIFQAAQKYLLQCEGIDVGSPRGVIRACRENGLFTETEARRALQMADDRLMNRYANSEAMNETLFSRIREYAPLLHLWLALLDK